MKVIKATQQMLETRTLVLGFQGENLRTQLRIDCASTFAEYPNATPALAIKPPSGETYPVFVDRDGNEVVWDIVANNLALKGDGELQLTFYKGDVIAKTSIGHITVNRSLQIDGEMPDVVATWIENANRKLAEVDAQIVELEGMVDTATDAATRAEQSASTASTKAEQAAGSAATATAKATEATNAAGTATAKAAEAEQSALTATDKATAAAESERIATAKAGDATTAAGTATAKAGQATEAAQTATEKAGDASASARAAHASEINAAESADDALAAKTAAEAAKRAAEASATQAAQSAQGAGTAAQTATQKAAEATQSATNAETFAGTATTKAEEAAESAQAASDAKTAVEQTAEQLVDSLEQIEQNTQDIAEHEQYAEATYATKNDLYKKADIIKNTASGAIASFPDGADGHPVDELKVAIEPVQDLHGYDHPWPAGGGKNLLAPVLFNNQSQIISNNITLTVVDQKFRLSGTASSSGGRTTLKTAVFTLPVGTYTLSRSQSVASVSVNNASNDSAIRIIEGSSLNTTFTISDETSVYVGFGGMRGTAYNETIAVQIESGSTATAWSPYANICPITGWTAVQIVVSPTTDVADGQTYDITLPTEAGTVYGGSLTIAEDGSGVLTVDRKIKTVTGGESWRLLSETYSVFGCYIGEGANYYKNLDTISNMYTKAKAYSWGLLDQMFNIADSYIGVHDSAHFTTAEEAKNYFAELYANGTPMQYILFVTSPLTYTLTASEIRTLLGTNNIWSDAGNVSVKYNADTKLYIDNKIAELVASIVNS